MNPKQKAAYLVVKYMSKVVSKNVAKECALVAVDEVINLINTNVRDRTHELIPYWQEVKQEIEKV